MLLLVVAVGFTVGCEQQADLSQDAKARMAESAKLANAEEVAAAEPVVPDLEAARKALEVGRRDEFEQMKLALELEGKQKQQFDKAVNNRAAKLENWRETKFYKTYMQTRKQLKAAEKDGNEEKVASLKQKLEPMSKKHIEFKEKIRAEVISELTPSQRKGWAGYVLWEKVRGRFRKAKPTDEQWQEMLEVTTDVAETLFAEGDITMTDPYLKSIYDVRDDAAEKIKQAVLTDEQREMFLPKDKR
jgi:hypothetical protein